MRAILLAVFLHGAHSFLFGAGGGGGGGGGCNCAARPVCPPAPACEPQPEACPPPVAQPCVPSASYAPSPPFLNLPQQQQQQQQHYQPQSYQPQLPPPSPPLPQPSSYAIPRVLQPHRQILPPPPPPPPAPTPTPTTSNKKSENEEYDEDSTSSSQETSSEKTDTTSTKYGTTKERREGTSTSEQYEADSASPTSVSSGRPVGALAEEMQDVYDDMSPVLEGDPTEAMVSSLVATEDQANSIDDGFADKATEKFIEDTDLLEVEASKMDISKAAKQIFKEQPQQPYKTAGVAQREAIRDAKCNSPALRRIMVENIVNSPTISKQLIYSAARYEYRRSIDVICARNSFSYVAVTSPVFCELTKGPITCFAFFQPTR